MANPAPPPDFPHWLRARQTAVERHLTRTLAALPAPPALAAAMQHAALAGGKRLRPAMLFAVAEPTESAESTESPLAAACAVELIHCYSLVHDDLPCMDDDDTRRGKPACHKAHGEAMALLAGDCLHSLAFSLLATSGLPAAACALLADAAGAAGMGGGQALDIAAAAVTEQQLSDMHNKKTGALFSCALQIGWLCRDRATPFPTALRDFGAHFGLLFQIANDIGDRTQDQNAGKSTYATRMAPDQARTRARQSQAAALAAIGPDFPHLANIARAAAPAAL